MILLIILPVLPVSATTTNKEVYRYTWKDDELISDFNQTNQSFYLSDNMDSSSLKISLGITPSPTLVKDLSSISILLNGIEVHSVLIGDLDPNQPLSIEVPGNKINAGRNNLAIKGFLKSTRERCEINPDINWLIIEEGSFYKLDYKRLESDYIKEIFENTCYLDGEKAEVNIVVPDRLNKQNYSQVSSLSALLGWANKNKADGISIKTFGYNAIGNLKRESIIIGTPDQLKSFNDKLFTEKEWQEAKEKGMLAIRKIGGQKHYIVMTSNHDQLELVNKTLQNKILLAQIKTKTYLLDSKQADYLKGFNTSPSLKELGYETTSQVGNGLKTFDYYFAIPANKTLTSDNMFSFAYNYSQLSDLDDAYVIVAINGEKVLSQKLSSENGEGKLKFSIPERYFEYAGFNLSLQFNLKPKLENCVTETFENVWIRVDSEESQFKIDLENRKEYSLLTSHGLIQDDNGYLQGSIDLDEYKGISLDSICDISAYLGKVSLGVKGLYMEETSDEGSKSRVLFTLNTDHQLAEVVKNSKSLSIIATPLDQNQLLIAATNYGQLNQAIKNYSKLTGPSNMLILQDGEVIESIDLKQDNKKVEAKQLKEKGIEKDIVIALVLLLVFTIFTFAIYYRKVK